MTRPTSAAAAVAAVLLVAASATLLAAPAAGQFVPSLPASFTASVQFSVPFFGMQPAHFYYDAVNERQRFDIKQFGVTTHMFMLYNYDKQYTVAQGSCDVSDLTGDFPNLNIPPGATFAGNDTFSGLPVEKWTVALPSGITAEWLVTVRDHDKSYQLVRYEAKGLPVKFVIEVDPDSINVGPIDPNIFDVTQFDGCEDPNPPPKFRVSGYVTDASTARPLTSASVTFDGQEATWSASSFSISLPAGKYEVKVTLDHYAGETRTIEVTENVAAGTGTADFTLSELLPNDNSWRFVLTWGQWPADLDSALAKTGGCTVNYRSRRCGEASLDRDDTQSYGPETITLLNAEDSEEYTHRVNVFTSGGSFHQSNAKVTVYRGEAAEPYKVLSVSDSATGKWWNTFTVKGSALTVVDTYSN